MKFAATGKCLLVGAFIAFSSSAHAQTQDTLNTNSNSTSNSTKEAVKYFFNEFLDWMALSYATYGGEMDAEVSSFFSTYLEKYKKKPGYAIILNEIDETVLYNGLEEASRDFFRKTGVRIYFPARIEDGSGHKYIDPLNQLLEQKTSAKSSPYIIVRSVLQGNHSSGYHLKVEVDASEEIRRNKYHLTESEKNPFQYAAGPFDARRDVGRTIRQGLIAGTSSLTADFEENFLPDLMVSHKGDYYKDGEVIEVPAQPNTWIELTAIGKDGNPRNNAQWSFAPADSVSARAAVDGAYLRFPGWHAGYYTIALRAGSNRATITLKVTNLRQMVKQILVELLTSKKQESLDTLAALRKNSESNAENLANYIAWIERGNFPMEPGGTLSPMFATPLVRSDSIAFLSDQDNRNSFNALKKKKKLRDAIRRKMNVTAFVDLVVDNPHRVNDLLEELLRNSGVLLAQLLLGKDSNGPASARNIIIEFLNDNLERIAGGEYAPSLSQEAPLIIPRPTGEQQKFDPKKFLYVSPQANFAGKEDLISQLNSYLPTQSPPLYVFINYSHDVDAESFLARSAARPVGLPEGARYKVFTVLNIPGSVKATVLSNTGSSTSITEAGGIKEKVFEDALASDAAYLSFEKRLLQEVGEQYEGFDCLSQSYARYKDVNERYKSDAIAFYAATIKFWLCATEKENCSEGKQYACGFTNGMLQELDWLTLVDAVSEFEMTKEDFEKILLCLVNDIPIGTHPSNPTFEDAVFKCFTGVSITGLKDGINEFVKENWDEPYYQGQATVFALTLISPFKAGIIKKLAKLAKYSTGLTKLKALSRATKAVELVDYSKTLVRYGDEVSDITTTLIKTGDDFTVVTNARKLPGSASGNGNVITGSWLRGTERNAGLFPQSVADKLKGKQFKNFDEFRQAFWKEVSNDPNLPNQLTADDLKRMKQGLAPIAEPEQFVGANRSYVLHHKRPINQGGAVYDMDNLYIVTPRYHKEILDPAYHYGYGY